MSEKKKDLGMFGPGDVDYDEEGFVIEPDKMKKHLWNLWSLTNGEMGEKPPEEEMDKWR